MFMFTAYTFIAGSRIGIYGEKNGCVQYEKPLFILPPFFVAPPPPISTVFYLTSFRQVQKYL